MSGSSNRKFGNQKLVEITHEDLRAPTDAIVERGAPATAVHSREVVLQVYRGVIERGRKVDIRAAAKLLLSNSAAALLLVVCAVVAAVNSPAQSPLGVLRRIKGAIILDFVEPSVQIAEVKAQRPKKPV